MDEKGRKDGTANWATMGSMGGMGGMGGTGSWAVVRHSSFVVSQA